MQTQAKANAQKPKVTLSFDTNIVGHEPTSFTEASKGS